MNILESYKRLSPGMRRRVLVAGAFGSVLIFSSFLMSVVEREAARTPYAEKPEVTVVSPQRTTGVEQFSAEIDSLKLQMKDLVNQMKSLQEQNEALKQRQKSEGPEFNAFNLDDSAPESNEEDFFDLDAEQVDPETQDATSDQLSDPQDRDTFALESPPPFPEAPAPSTSPSPPPESALPTVQEAPPVTTVQPQFRIFTESGEIAGEALNREMTATEESSEEKVYIPAGSMFTGVLLNGLDAPTTSAAQKNPTPVVMRVKREAILPNYASIDVRECFLLAAGYGQLSSERVIMRSETLSCVRTDGQVFEIKLDSYIVGTDGKVGMPGRLVSKQGQMIARSLLAGVFSGLGEALDVDKVSSLNIDPDGSSIYEQENMASVFQSGTASGLSSAANMIAKFYLDMAEETFPVVEVPAGEVGTVVVTRGGVLPLKGSASLQLYANSSQTSKNQTVSPVKTAPDTQPSGQPLPPVMPRLDPAFNAQPSSQSGTGW